MFACLSDVNIKKTYTAQKSTIHQITTMLATSENVLIPGNNNLLTTGADEPSL